MPQTNNLNIHRILSHNNSATMPDKPRGCLPSKLKFLVWAFQCLGLLCYKRSSSPTAADGAEISVPLLLWVIFVKMFQMSQILSYASFKDVVEKDNVGTLTTNMSVIISISSIIIGHTSLIIKGPILCHILSEFEKDACVRKDKQDAIISLKNIMNAVFYCSHAAGILITLVTLRPDTDIRTVIFFVHCSAVVAGMMLTAMLFREVLAIASSKLSVDSPDGCCRSMDGLNRRLNSLERTVRQVSSNMCIYVPVFYNLLTLFSL